MPLQRCRNFNEDGSRKLKPNGYEVQCHPDCQFVHPSDPAWDRARPSGLRGRGGHPYAPRGRNHGAPGSGANSHPLGSNQGNSSNSWDDYISGSGSNVATTSSGWGTSSRWDSHAKVETSGWGENATGDSGWGSNMKNDVGVPERKSAEPASSDVKSSTSQWGGHSADLGAPGERWGMSSGIGWGSADTGPEPGWGQDSMSTQWGTTPSETATSNMGSSMVVDVDPSRIEYGNGAKTANSIPLVVPADPVSSRHDHKRANQPIRVSTTPSASDPLPTERAVSSPLSRRSPLLNSTNKSQSRRRSEGNSGQVTLESLSTDSEMSQLVLCIAAMLKIRKLDTELAQWSALRKSPRLVMPRVDKDLLQTKYQEFKDTQLAVKAAAENRTAKLGLPNILFSSMTRAQDTERLRQLEAWVSRAEGCLGDLPPEGDSTLRVKKMRSSAS
ncbi:hypothetical protein EI94DRAFT_295557 [Lactarius quietus]|nr:hypothetical protein EI94DRAFT_295557 [Lactarius quietus]